MVDTEKPRFPLPERYWDHGNQLSYRTLKTQFENYLEWDAVHQLDKEYRNRLLYSLLGAEGTQRFASQPLAQQLADSDHDAYAKAISEFFEELVNELHAEFNFQSCRQGPGEFVAEFLAALCTLLVDLKGNGTAAQERLLAKQLVFGCRDRSVMLQ